MEFIADSCLGLKFRLAFEYDLTLYSLPAQVQLAPEVSSIYLSIPKG